jgi:prophage regulatory protein
MLRNDVKALDANSAKQLAKFARLPSVVRFTGLGRSTIYRMIAAKEFPAPFKLGSRAVGWRWSDLDAWSETRVQKPH